MMRTTTPVRLLVSALACAALALPAAGCAESGGAATTASGKGGLVGAKAPDFTAEAVSGEGPTTLKEAQGKVVILDFWATFCEPCKKSFPKYQELVEQFGGDVTVIAVSVDEADSATKEQLTDFAKKTGVRFAIVWDKDQSVAKKYRPAKMPTSFVIDKDGKVRHVHAGYQTGEEATISDEIKAILGK